MIVNPVVYGGGELVTVAVTILGKSMKANGCIYYYDGEYKTKDVELHGEGAESSIRAIRPVKNSVFALYLYSNSGHMSFGPNDPQVSGGVQKMESTGTESTGLAIFLAQSNGKVRVINNSNS